MPSNHKPIISAIGTAVPIYKIDQTTIADYIADFLQFDPEARKQLQILYRASGIRYRHSVIPDFDQNTDRSELFHLPSTNNVNEQVFPTISQRMGVYREEAGKLCLKAIADCTKRHPSGENITKEITHLVTVSCTGMYAPGIDIEIINGLGLPGTTQRTSINFMGCYGMFNAFKVADAISRSDKTAKVLIVSVELCSLHLQKENNEDALLSAALFSDGAGAAIVESAENNLPGLSLEHFYCDIIPEGKKEMAWEIGDFAFEMKLSAYIPNLIGKGIEEIVLKLLENYEHGQEGFSHYAIHPGGKKILEKIETSLRITKNDNRFAYQVLKAFGNMSSATILFVLKALVDELGLTRSKPDDSILALAFGPGLTVESMVLKPHFQ